MVIAHTATGQINAQILLSHSIHTYRFCTHANRIDIHIITKLQQYTFRMRENNKQKNGRANNCLVNELATVSAGIYHAQILNIMNDASFLYK